LLRKGEKRHAAASGEGKKKKEENWDFWVGNKPRGLAGRKKRRRRVDQENSAADEDSKTRSRRRRAQVGEWGKKRRQGRYADEAKKKGGRSLTPSWL